MFIIYHPSILVSIKCNKHVSAVLSVVDKLLGNSYFQVINYCHLPQFIFWAYMHTICIPPTFYCYIRYPQLPGSMHEIMGAEASDILIPASVHNTEYKYWALKKHNNVRLMRSGICHMWWQKDINKGNRLIHFHCIKVLRIIYKKDNNYRGWPFYNWMYPDIEDRYNIE